MIEKDKISFDILLRKALEARKRSYSPYSKFKVGAAVIDENNNIYTGCNIESASYGLTVCAERNAVYSAISSEAGKLKTILIVADTNDPVRPCGSCRQVIYEHAPDISVIMCNTKGDYQIEKINKLLKFPFGLDN